MRLSKQEKLHIQIQHLNEGEETEMSGRGLGVITV
jgi:hypothetical protein